MVKDLVELIGEQPFESADIMGHSMGGKTAMLTALMHPELVEHLIVVDIVPKEYPPFHRNILDGLLSLDTAAISSREEADAALKEKITAPDVRAFLLTNLVKRNAGYGWRINLETLSRDYDQIAGWPERCIPAV